MVMDLISTWIPWSDGCSGMVRAWRWVRIIAPLYLIGCLLILWDVCGGFGHVAPEVKVPSLQRLSVTTATERLQRLGIAVIIVDGDRSDGYSQGMVMEQS